jgi:hypothetical protein
MDRESPPGEVALLDVMEEVGLRKVHIYGLHVIRLFPREVLDALLRFEVILHIKQFILGIDQREGMA